MDVLSKNNEEEVLRNEILNEYLQKVNDDKFEMLETESESEETEGESESDENEQIQNEFIQEITVERESVLKEYLKEFENKKISFKRKLSVLHEKPTIDNIIQKIKLGKINNIIMMIGAGVSVNAGIPDFRSPKTGLYANLQGKINFKILF